MCVCASRASLRGRRDREEERVDGAAAAAAATALNLRA